MNQNDLTSKRSIQEVFFKVEINRNTVMYMLLESVFPKYKNRTPHPGSNSNNIIVTCPDIEKVHML